MPVAEMNGYTKVTFDANLPTQVTLKFDSAKPVTSQRDGATQYLYTCEEGSMYVTPHLHELIEASGAKRGDVLSITKRVRRIGQQQQQHWDVQIITAQATRTKEPEPWDEPHDHHEPEQPPPPRVKHARYPFPSHSKEDEEFYSHGVETARIEAAKRKDAAAAAATPAPAPAPAPKSHADALLESLTAAIDAAAVAEKHAARVGMQIRFGAEDVRAMALSLYIGRTREGGR